MAGGALIANIVLCVSEVHHDWRKSRKRGGVFFWPALLFYFLMCVCIIVGMFNAWALEKRFFGPSRLSRPVSASVSV